MKMAKASEADLNMAMDLCGMLDALGHRHCPSMPAVIARNDGDEDFDLDDDAQCGRALRALLETADRGSLGRVVWGAAVMLNPRNKLVDPDADTIEHHPERAQAAAERDRLRAEVEALRASRGELLEVLRVVVRDWTEQFERHGSLAPEWCKQARAAIAKAEAGNG
jgi:hypothetical protein